MNKKEIAILVREAKKIGLIVTGEKRIGGQAHLTFANNNYPLHVAHAFANKYDGRIITIMPEHFIVIKHSYSPYSTEVDAYHDARIALAVAEHNLNQAVQPILSNFPGNRNSAECLEFIQLLPKNYPGVRRFYECMLRANVKV